MVAVMDIQREREAFEKEMLNSRYVAGNISAFWDKKTQDYDIAITELRMAWHAWQAAKAHEAEKLKGCVVVPVELSESIAEKLALEKVEKPRQENDVVWQEIADRSYKDHLIQKKWEIIRNYKELVEAARGGNE